MLYEVITLQEYKDGLFMASLYSTIIIPIWLYIFIWFYKRTHTEESVSYKQYRKMKKELKQKLKENGGNLPEAENEQNAGQE